VILIVAFIVSQIAASVLFYVLIARLREMNVRVQGIERRFTESGVDLVDKLATDVVITEKWIDWDRLTDEEVALAEPGQLPSRKPDLWDD